MFHQWILVNWLSERDSVGRPPSQQMATTPVEAALVHAHVARKFHTDTRRLIPHTHSPKKDSNIYSRAERQRVGAAEERLWVQKRKRQQPNTCWESGPHSSSLTLPPHNVSSPLLLSTFLLSPPTRFPAKRWAAVCPCSPPFCFCFVLALRSCVWVTCAGKYTCMAIGQVQNSAPGSHSG